MSSERPEDSPTPGPAGDPPTGTTAASTPGTPPEAASAAAAGDSAPASTLSPEEQMALYEKELKETDWGHQPC
jgi:hypothetical protein